MLCRIQRVLVRRRPLLSDVPSPSRRFLALSAVMQTRFEELLQQHQTVLDEMQTNPKLGHKLSKLNKYFELSQTQTNLKNEQASFLELQKEAEQTSDKELYSECSAELARIQQELIHLENDIIDAILPSSQHDDSDAILELRAGTGGDEASYFGAELLEAYLKTARNWNLKTTVLEKSTTEGGKGVTAASIQIDKAYGLFCYESGVHRVQRIPVNATKIHTSAVSVAVLPVVSDSDYTIDPSELRIDTMRSSGAGGQHVNTTNSAVRITHIPTGIVASIQDERSQHQNKAKALKLIQARVADCKRQQELQDRNKTRSSLLGGGDRSERVRTYNYPQDRITDHRCKETKHGIEKMLAGNSDDGLVSTFLPFLSKLRREEQLQELET